MKDERIKDIMEENEDIRQVPLEPGRPADHRQDYPVGDSYMGGRPRREAVSRRKPGAGAKGRKLSGGSETGEKGTRFSEGSETGGTGTRFSGGSETGGTGTKLPRESVTGGKGLRARRVPDAGDKESESRGRRGQDRKKPSRSAKGQGGSGRGVSVLLILLVLVIGIGAGLGGGYYLWGWERPYTVDLKAVEVPEWVEQDFIRKNIFSRPDVGRQRVDKIVIHYVGNPGTTAKNNRDYFDSLADQNAQEGGTSTSSHFVVGLEGEVIQCIPVSEIAYANAPLNNTTIAIEVCHPDESGKFNDATYESVVNLTAWLCKQLKLSSEDVIRHYDVNGKICPKYYVDNEDAWKQFHKDVQAAIKNAGAVN